MCCVCASAVGGTTQAMEIAAKLREKDSGQQWKIATGANQSHPHYRMCEQTAEFRAQTHHTGPYLQPTYASLASGDDGWRPPS